MWPLLLKESGNTTQGEKGQLVVDEAVMHSVDRFLPSLLPRP